MELQNFVTNTIQQILQGVADVRNYAKEYDAKIAPIKLAMEPTLIEFDVGVTTEDASSRKAGAGVSVSVFSFGGQGEKDTARQVVNRIRFSVPVVLPTTHPVRMGSSSTKTTKRSIAKGK